MTTRNALNKWLHWGHSLLMSFVLLAPAAGITAAYATVALIWSGVFVFKGATHKPGPKLDATMRQVHIWGHRSLHAVIFAAGLSGLAQLAGLDAPFRTLVLVLVGAGALHAVFHLWRHTTLMDGALKLIFPKAIHGIL